jgi:hypothetical protein
VEIRRRELSPELIETNGVVCDRRARKARRFRFADQATASGVNRISSSCDELKLLPRGFQS